MSIKYVLNPFTGIPEPQEVGTGGPPTGPAGGDLSGTYPNPTVVALEETGGPTRLAYGAIPDGTALVRSGTTVVGVPYCTTNNVSMPGLYACAENDSTIASGYASSAQGRSSRAGLALQNFTIPAGGTLVTIAGDVRNQFEQGQPSVRITPTVPASAPTVSRTVTTAPAFAAGNTTFSINAPVDGSTTAGTIVQSDSAPPANATGTMPAGGTLVTIPGDVTGSFFNNQSVRIFPRTPVELADVIRTIVTPPIFGGVNTTFTLNAAIDPSTTSAIFYASQARGQAAHAEGVGTVADGYAAHAEGLALASSNDGSHAEGIATRALGRGSHAEGWFDPTVYDRGPVAYLNGGHAEGEHTLAGGNDTHAEGINTAAAGFAAHSEGQSTTAGGDFSHAEGNGAIAGNPLRTFTIAAGGTAVTLPGGNFTAEFVNGQRATFFPQTPAYIGANTALVSSVPVFAAGNTTFNIAQPIDATTTGGLCVDTSFGQSAHAEGTSRASGGQSHAQNTSCVASGPSSHAQNISCTASGDGATAGGNATLASGVIAVAFGDQSLASGRGSFTTGLQAVASGLHACAFGNITTANGVLAFATGDNSIASGRCALSQGTLTNSAGDNAFAGGANSIASGLDSFAFGFFAEATGKYSQAFGVGSLASQESDWAFAASGFAGLADAQVRPFRVFRGATAGAAPGEAVVLVTGTSPVEEVLVNNKRYLVTMQGVAAKPGAGAGVPDFIAYSKAFVATVNNAGAVTLSAVTDVFPAIVGGAGFVGATLVPSSAAANNLRLTFTIAGGLTTASRIVVNAAFVELLGS